MDFKYTLYVDVANEDGLLFGATSNNLCRINVERIPFIKKPVQEKKAANEPLLIIFALEEYVLFYLDDHKEAFMSFLHHDLDFEVIRKDNLLCQYEKEIKRGIDHIKQTFKGEKFSSIHFIYIPKKEAEHFTIN